MIQELLSLTHGTERVWKLLLKDGLPFSKPDGRIVNREPRTSDGGAGIAPGRVMVAGTFNGRNMGSRSFRIRLCQWRQSSGVP